MFDINKTHRLNADNVVFMYSLMKVYCKAAEES